MDWEDTVKLFVLGIFKKVIISKNWVDYFIDSSGSINDKQIEFPLSLVLFWQKREKI